MRRLVGAALAVLFVWVCQAEAVATDWAPVDTTEGLSTFFTEQGDALIAGSAAAGVTFDSTATEAIDSASIFVGSAGADTVTLLAEVYPAGSETVASTDVTTSTFRPTDDLQIGGNDSESNKWLTQALGSTNLYQTIDEATLDPANYIGYVGTAAGNRRYRFTVDTGGADWPASQRVVGGRVSVVASREEIAGQLEISYFDGTDTYRLGVVTATKARKTLSVDWPEYNPATRLPWTRAEIQALDTGGGAAIQIRPLNVGAQKTLRVFQAWVELDWVAETRVAVGRATGVSQGEANTWVPFSLSVPNTGVDNWAKASGSDYTLIVRRITGMGSTGWRHLDETAEVASVLGRPSAGLMLPISSYVPTMDNQGFVSAMGDPVAGRAMAFYLTTSGAAVSVDGQPYNGFANALTSTNFQTFTPATTGTYPVIRFFGAIADPATPFTVRVLNAAHGSVVASQAVTAEEAGVAALWEGEVNETQIALYEVAFDSPPSLTGGTTYSLDLEFASGDVVTSMVAATYASGLDAPSYGGSTDDLSGRNGDVMFGLSTQPTALTGFSATPEPRPTGLTDAACTVAWIDRVRIQHEASVLAGSFARYEIERQTPDGAWEPIIYRDATSETVNYDWEGRLGQTETYRARQVRGGDFIASEWTASDTAAVARYGYETKVASNHLGSAVAYERLPEYQREYPREFEVVPISGRDGRYVFTQAENQGSDEEATLVLFAGTDGTPAPDEPGWGVTDTLADYLRGDVPHFAVCDADGNRVYGHVALGRATRSEPDSLYLAPVTIHESQFAPTPVDG